MAETVRACRREDIPTVAGMFSRVFLKQTARAGRWPGALLRRVGVRRTSFTAARRARACSSTPPVEVRGFIGVWPRPMILQGRSIEAAAAGSLMVEQPEQHPTAGARLLRAFLSGPQDLSFSETSNHISQRMWQKAGGERLTATSVDWLRILRPAGFATHMAGTAFAPAGWLGPLAKIADRVIQARTRHPLFVVARARRLHRRGRHRRRDRRRDWRTEPKLRAAPRLADARSAGAHGARGNQGALRADPSAHRLRPQRRTRRLLPLSRATLAASAACCSCWRARRPWASRSIVCSATPPSWVASACAGAPSSTPLDPLIVRGCLLFHVSAMMVHARDKSLLAEVRNARSMLTGLAGESWTRLIGGKFV